MQWWKPRNVVTLVVLMVCVGLFYCVWRTNSDYRLPEYAYNVHGATLFSTTVSRAASNKATAPRIYVNRTTPITLTFQELNFDPHGNDTLVFIHIQKSGGSDFLRHLVSLKKGEVSLCGASESSPVTKTTKLKRVHARVLCPRDWNFPNGEPWLIAEKTLGWFCGLHASYTEFQFCLPHHLESKFPQRARIKRRLHFATMLRHPVLRYISEYLHVQRGASWSSRHWCGGRAVTDAEMPPCYPGYYDGVPWANVTLQEFLSCESNWANNRQTMMLADLMSIDCYNKSQLPENERQKFLVESAKRNLENFAYFGLTEYQEASGLLFERTFGLEFGIKMEQRALSNLHSAPMLQRLWTGETYDRVASVNFLDMELYVYALRLFAQRLEDIGMKIDFNKTTQEIDFLDSEQVANTAKKFSRLKYDLP